MTLDKTAILNAARACWESTPTMCDTTLDEAITLGGEWKKSAETYVEMAELAIKTYLANTITELDCLEAEIQGIVNVAKRNPAGLVDFIKCNFPKEWGLTKEEHRAHINGDRP